MFMPLHPPAAAQLILHKILKSNFFGGQNERVKASLQKGFGYF